MCVLIRHCYGKGNSQHNQQPGNSKFGASRYVLLGLRMLSEICASMLVSFQIGKAWQL